MLDNKGGNDEMDSIQQSRLVNRVEYEDDVEKITRQRGYNYEMIKIIANNVTSILKIVNE